MNTAQYDSVTKQAVALAEDRLKLAAVKRMHTEKASWKVKINKEFGHLPQEQIKTILSVVDIVFFNVVENINEL